MSSIISEIQNDVIAKDCDVVSILRKAHLVASKLGLSEFDEWITYELNGYPNMKIIPEYRHIRGKLRAFNPYRGWIPVLVNSDKMEDKVCRIRVSNAVSEIISMCASSDDDLVSEFSAGMQNQLVNAIDPEYPMNYALHLPNSAVKDVIEKVKNTILEWTLKLESEGIIGENMTFTSTEKQAALNVPQTINNYYGNTNVMNGSIDRSSIVAGDNTAVSFTYEAAQAAADEIKASLVTEPIAQDDKDSAIEMLTEINDKIANQKKPSVIKAALTGLKDFLIGVGASATVALVQAKLQGLF